MRRLLVLAVVLAGCTDGRVSQNPPTTGASTTVARTTTSNDAICRNDRRKLEEAKAARLGGDSAERRQKVDDTARQARRDGCDISDLVGDNVGAG